MCAIVQSELPLTISLPSLWNNNNRACDDMAHSQNEKYNCINLVNGIKVLGLYLHELGEIKGPKPSSCRCIPLTDEELMVPGAFLKGFRCKCEM